MSNLNILLNRREILFLYDIKMGNPNGDPDENRPRVLPDGTYYVTDVRLKRFVRDYLKQKGLSILVDNIEGRTTNLTGRVVHHLKEKNLDFVQGKELVDVLLDEFVDARLFGSSLAFKAEKLQKNGAEANYEPKPEPKTLTGAVQFNMGEVLHGAEAIDIHGTSVFSSDSQKSQGTFTSYYALRYGLIGFSGVVNQHSAALSRLTSHDYERLLRGLWNGVRSAANTRTKVGQVPRFLLSVEYREGEEFQFGRLHDYVRLNPRGTKIDREWASPEDYKLDLGLLMQRIAEQADRIKTLRYAISPDIHVVQEIPSNWDVVPVDDWS